MASLLSNRRHYQESWKEVSREKFTEEDINSIKSIDVVASNYGISAHIEFNNGECDYIPISKELDLSIGQILEPHKCFLVHLQRGIQTTDKLLYEE